MDWTGLSCDVVKIVAIAAIFVGMFANPFDRPYGRYFPRRYGFPAIAIFFFLVFALMASDRC